MNNAIREFKNRNIVVNCISEFEANNFLKICNRHGLRWLSGNSLIEFNCWHEYRDKTIYGYYCGGVCYANVWCGPRNISYNEFIEMYNTRDEQVHVTIDESHTYEPMEEWIIC